MDNWKLVPLVIIAPPILIVGAFLTADMIEHKKRFGLRALIAAMTVVAVMIGWLAYSLRK